MAIAKRIIKIEDIDSEKTMTIQYDHIAQSDCSSNIYQVIKNQGDLADFEFLYFRNENKNHWVVSFR